MDKLEGKVAMPAHPIESALFVQDSGSGAPVVLLHSSGLSGRQWRRLCSELASTMRVVVPDLSGHGRSDPWPEPRPFSFRTDVEHVLRILRQLGPTHLIGHSYGGFVAAHSALATPTLVRSLSLFDPAAFGALDPNVDRDALDVLSKLDLSWGQEATGHERWLRTFVDFWGGPGAWAALREDARAEFLRVAWVVREGVVSMLADATPFDAFREFTFPVQLVTGEHSPFPAGRVIERFGEVIPVARIATIPGAGHLAPVTHADEVNRVLVRALTAAGQTPIAVG
jgi:pimeloyl-ACP methyl ester carboxylesterase